MLMIIIGFYACWIILALIAYISETKNTGGIALFDGWAVTVLLLPILISFWAAYPFYALYKIVKAKQK